MAVLLVKTLGSPHPQVKVKTYMRRLFIIRRDLHLTPGKLGAMIAHCSESYWLNLIGQNTKDTDGKHSVSFVLPDDIFTGYIKKGITKTICEAKNLNKLLQARDMALSMGLKEEEDFGLICDACHTELTPEAYDENGEGYCTVGIWFKPLEDDTAHLISRKYSLYRD